MRREVFGGLFLIFLGVIFILNNFGYLGWDIWSVFLEFWPLLLIVGGLRLIFLNNITVQIIAFLLLVIIPLAYYLYQYNGFFFR